MKAWLKGGLIGAGIVLILGLLYSLRLGWIIPDLHWYYQYMTFSFWILFLIFGIVIGAIIGAIIGKIVDSESTKPSKGIKIGLTIGILIAFLIFCWGLLGQYFDKLRLGDQLVLRPGETWLFDYYLRFAPASYIFAIGFIVLSILIGWLIGRKKK